MQVFNKLVLQKKYNYKHVGIDLSRKTNASVV